MRRSIIAGATALTLMLAMACWAQSGASSEQQEQQEQQNTTQQPMEGHEHMRGAEGAQNRLDWLSQQLNLTDDQKAQLQPILQKEEQQMMSIHENTSLSRDEMRSQMMQVHQSTESQIDSILTPDQQQKFAQIKQQHKERHDGHMGSSEENQQKH